MKILSMTATFGKLDGATLTLKPDLNVITAPNEWGKSTWCAFVTAMLYGIETSQRTSSKGIADKERFAPWNGKPMSGRMDLLWNGKKITIERSTKSRSIFGVFKAYETDTGLDVPELTAENCGLTLVGVEKNVFLRAGFIRQTEMPVTNDLALRRRLNELVTTGDESGASDKLAKTLKDLKNACRHNKTGLLPQAESQRTLIQEKLNQIETAQAQMERIGQRQEQLKAEIAALENHKLWLSYEDAKQNMDRVDAAKKQHQQALSRVRELEAQAAELPAQEFAQKKLQQAEEIQTRWTQLQEKKQPQPPQPPAAFADVNAGVAWLLANRDKAAYDALKKKSLPLFLILAVLGLAAGIGLFFYNSILILVGVALAGIFAGLHFASVSKKGKALAKLQARYGDLPADKWISTAEAYGKEKNNYDRAVEELEKGRAALQEETEALTGGKTLQEILDSNREVIALWKTLADAKVDARKAAAHAEAMAAMVQTVPKPQAEDHLTDTLEETNCRLDALLREQSDLQRKQGQFMGQMQTLGSAEDLTRQLQQVNVRIAKLEDIYAALVIAQETLTEAANELQRRFAPKIAQKARDIFFRLTGGRYDRLILEQDLSVSAGAEGESTLHSSAWRSDGTIDQLYLSVRLAVAEALTPDAPIVLDDALVRFDDTRLKETMALLKELSGEKQIILFTCQDRERNYE